MKAFLSLAIVLALASTARGQGGCYGGCYGGQVATQSVYAVQQPVAAPALSSAFCGAQTQQVAVMHVPVAIHYQTVAVAAPQCQQQAVAAPQTYAVPQCAPVAVGVPFAAVQSYGAVGYGGGLAVSHNVGFANRGFVNQRFVGVNQFAAQGIVSGTGVSANFVDRRGNSVNAVGAQNVRVKRNLLGGIKEVTVDQPRRGFLGL
jgi:hypothetical protein